MNRAPLVAISAALILALSGCAGEPPDRTATSAAAPTRSSPEGEAPSRKGAINNLDSPPPVTVHFSDSSANLKAWTYCYGNVCVDGAPPEDPLDVGNPGSIVFEFPEDDWTFRAIFTPSGEKCGRNQVVWPQRVDDRRFELRPAGRADTYDVTLFGRGNGDLSVTFRWTTPTDGPLPEPKARLAVLAGDKQEVLSYGVELDISNLARTPRRAEATITVKASNGESITFDAKRARGRCFAEGTVYWDGPDDKGLAAARLEGSSFTYEVEVMLDGKRYVATARWPEDEIKGFGPSVPLVFTPDLPEVE